MQTYKTSAHLSMEWIDYEWLGAADEANGYIYLWIEETA
jgi:hypothetical protein